MQPERQGDRTLRAYLRTVRRRKEVVLLAMFLVPAAALVASARQTAVYEASARVLVSQDSIAGDLLGARLEASSKPPDREVKTQAQLAHAPAVAQRVLAAVPVEGESVQGLLRHSSVSAHPDADILAFSVQDADARLAQRLANEYAHQYTLYRRQLDTMPIEQALTHLRRQLADLGASGGDSGSRAALAQKARQLRTLQALDVPSASVVDRADSARKTRPQTARNGVVGLLLGTLFGLGLAFLWEALDTRLRSAAEISDGLGLPLLARVPANHRRFGPDSVPVMLSEPQSREAEAFRFLRANLEFVNRERRARTIMVSSAHPGEGKSSVAVNLGVALARAGRQVTLVDLDLRKPSLARFFRLHGGAGLTDVALGSATLDEALATIWTHEPNVNGKRNGSTPARALRVLTSGPTPPDAGEFRMTLAIDSIIGKLRGISELVVIDSPPLLGVGDAVTLSGKVDAILLVVRGSVLRQPTLGELRRVLVSCPAEKLGFVLTEAELDERLGGDGSHNGRSSKPARDPLKS
jgi:succinoglycan biosynthesis transport protein ExoP